MIQLRQELVRQLREQAGRGVAPAEMLRSLLPALAPQEPPGATLVLHLMEVFGLEQYQANCVFGWAPDGPRELSDDQLNDLLRRRLRPAQGVAAGG